MVPLVDLPSLRAIPVSFATDGIAIKPGLQFDTRVKNLVGLLFPVDLDYVKMNPSPEPESLKTAFVTEVNCENVTSLDNRLSRPVGLEYSGKRVSGDDKADTINKRVKQLQICLFNARHTNRNERHYKFRRIMHKSLLRYIVQYIIAIVLLDI